MKNILGEKAKVHSHKPEESLEIGNLDSFTTEKEVQEPSKGTSMALR